MSKPADACGCCAPPPEPPSLDNRPGLPALAYRIGTHPSFLARMLARLPAQTIPPDDPNGARPLNALTTRSTSDPAIALLDAWAVVADVLTFYQERIANEGYLRTATERRSVLELSRTIGYELRPGVAAEAFLAFTVEDALGSPGLAILPAGTKVQSVPGPGELPQTFETSAEITARAECNALRPRLTRPQELALHSDGKLTRLYLLGLSTHLGDEAIELQGEDCCPLDPALPIPSGPIRAVELSLVYLKGTETNLKAGDLLLFVGKNATEAVLTLVLPVRRVAAEVSQKRTRVELGDDPAAELPRMPTFRHRIYETALLQIGSLAPNRYHFDALIGRGFWRERDLSAFVSIQGWERASVVQYLNAPPVPPLPPADAGIFGFGVRTAPFGHNAPLWLSLPVNHRYAELNNSKPVPFAVSWDGSPDNSTTEPAITEQSQPLGGNSLRPRYAGNYDADFFCERTIPEAVPGGWVLVEGAGKRSPYRIAKVREASLADFAISAKATGVRVSDATDLDKFKLRSTTIHLKSLPFELIELPIEDDLVPKTAELQLNGLVLGLQAGQPLALTGERADLPGVTASEVVILADVAHSGGFTLLTFKEGLARSYVRKTVTLNANVVRATHGETVFEILGNGDGARPNQTFVLKKPPLTYVSANTASGTQNTLRVRVNDVLWLEAPQLYGLDSSAESYFVRRDNDGPARVIFGDGVFAARLPTGTSNVTATYRSGIGKPGMVEDGKLTLLQTRPLGVRGVVNPLPASGAADPESRADAQTNAPLTVLTLDRIVSLRDFEDFARGFAGIGKAKSVALWQGETHLVHVTVAASAGTAAAGADPASPLTTHILGPKDSLFTNLRDAVANVSDPGQRFLVDSYQPVYFNLKATVLVDPRRERAQVLAAVEQALIAAFAFERRGFGQPVTTAEIVTAIQGVAGVIACDLVHLYRYEEGKPPPGPAVELLPITGALPAAAVQRVGDRAELLLVNPVGITLEEMKS